MCEIECARSCPACRPTRSRMSRHADKQHAAAGAGGQDTAATAAVQQVSSAAQRRRTTQQVRWGTRREASWSDAESSSVRSHIARPWRIAPLLLVPPVWLCSSAVVSASSCMRLPRCATIRWVIAWVCLAAACARAASTSTRRASGAGSRTREARTSSAASAGRETSATSAATGNTATSRSARSEQTAAAPTLRQRTQLAKPRAREVAGTKGRRSVALTRTPTVAGTRCAALR